MNREGVVTMISSNVRLDRDDIAHDLNSVPLRMDAER